MRFFEHQEAARKRSRWLTASFAVAVAAAALAVNLIIPAGLLLPGEEARYALREAYASGAVSGIWVAHAWITALVLSVILGAYAFKIAQLARGGGDGVAQMLGGTRIGPGGEEPASELEARLANIVEEMSIASGVPMPSVWVLREERGINAFAAGFLPSDSAVAVTRGAIERLDRDELQGVIAHEFSHILNGDMRLSMRLVGMLFGLGILTILGTRLLRLASRMRSGGSKNAGQAMLAMLGIGLALAICGWVGSMLGGALKAAISRQREYLADASAAQFTRNPDGIGRALSKIAWLAENGPGSSVAHPEASAMSHLLFAEPKAFLSLEGIFATHPPLEERIARIYGGRKMEPIKNEAEFGAEGYPKAAAFAGGGRRRPARELAPIDAGELALAADLRGADFLAWAKSGRDPKAGAPAGAEERGEADRVAAALEAFGKGDKEELASFLGGLASTPEKAAAATLSIFGASEDPEQAPAREFLAKAGSRWRLRLLDAAAPGLRALAAPARMELFAKAKKAALEDGKIELFEACALIALRRRLLLSAGERSRVSGAKIGSRAKQAALALGWMAKARALEQGRQDWAHAAKAALARLGIAAEEGDFGKFRFEAAAAAVDDLSEISPLEQARLIRELWRVGGGEEGMGSSCEDLLRAFCAALDCPLPPGLALEGA